MTADLETIRGEIRRTRFSRWHDFLSFLERTAEPDHTLVRFPNSSSYIFSTGSNCFWMVDPSYSYEDRNEKELSELADLMREKISFILTTHLHGDHCQPEWISGLADSNIKWVVSNRFSEPFLQQHNASRENTIILADNETIELCGIKITARSGYHNEPGKPEVPSCAYDVELPDGVKLFFPGDIRDPRAAVPAGEVDYTFGHVFLGRDDAAGNHFPLLDDFCHFFAKRKSSHLILNHLYEIGRAPADLWTHRHAGMIKEKLCTIAPEMQITAPRFGNTQHLTKDHGGPTDLFQDWKPSAQQEFLQQLGISIKQDHLAQMEECIVRAIPVVEWSCGLIKQIPLAELLEQKDRWRAAGGKCLSIHFPNFPKRRETEFLENFHFLTEIALQAEIDRATIHVPACTVGAAEKSLDPILDFCAGLLKPLLDAGIRIGIENLHMKPNYQADDTRPTGFLPEEVLLIVNGLRERCRTDLIGCHLDIGHAYSNAPYAEEFDLPEWFRVCGPLINGVHLHQFRNATTPEDPYSVGHSLIAGRNFGHPNLFPLYDAWAKAQFRAPMILEIRNEPETTPFNSLERMKYLLEVQN